MNKALEKLREINPFYRTVSVDNSWENVSQESDSELWDILNNENTKHDKADIIDSNKKVFFRVQHCYMILMEPVSGQAKF